MARPPVLLALVLAACTLARALERPVYVGAADPARCSSWFGIAWPFGDDLKGSSDAFLSLQARSLVREGLAATGGVPLFNVEHAPPQSFFYYDHHPPGVALLTALAFTLFGESEAVARCVALLFSTLTLVAIARLVRRNAGDGTAMLAVVAIAAAPIGLYWSTHLDYFVPAIAACAAFMGLALREAPTRRTTALAVLALLAAMALDSLAALAAVAVACERLLPRRRSWRAALGWPALAGLCAFGWLVWKFLQESRHGHGDGADPISHFRAEWSLHPECASVAALLGAVERHVRELVTPLGELVIAAGVALALRGGRSRELESFVRASTLVALATGTLPRLRAWDHPYFQLYWLLPLGASIGLIAVACRDAAARGGRMAPLARLASRGAPLLAVAFVAVGWLARPRSTPAADRPSAHRLGLELAAAAPRDVHVIALPSAARFDVFVPSWYAGRIVLKLPPGNETRGGIAGALAALGLSADSALLAPDARWPGRSGLVPLPK